jgi:IclR family acetate operon transcriptional repressor
LCVAIYVCARDIAQRRLFLLILSIDIGFHMPMVQNRPEKLVGVGVISKVFRILEAIQGSPSGLTLKPICDATGVQKSTAHRFLKHLEREGYLLRTQDGAYLIGPRLSQMSARANHRATLQALARPILWELWKSTSETVNLGVLDDGNIVYLEVIESPHEFRLASRVGGSRSLHSTALGKAVAAFLPEDSRERVLARVSFQPLTPKTIRSLVQFREELEIIRRQGYAVDDEETTLGARCVGASILGANGVALAAVSVSGQVPRISPDQVPAFAGALRSATRAISAAMGFSETDTLPVEPSLRGAPTAR